MNKYIFAGCLIFFFSKAVNATKDSNISILNNVYFKNFYIIPTYHANMISLDLYPKVKMCIRKTKEGTNIEAKLYTVHCVVYRVQLQEQHGLNTALARATATADGTFTPSTGKRAASRTISVTEPPTPSGLPVISAVRASPPAHHPSGRAQQKGEKRERETGTEERRSGGLTPPPPSSFLHPTSPIQISPRLASIPTPTSISPRSAGASARAAEKMEAIRKQASKFREQVARQQQVSAPHRTLLRDLDLPFLRAPAAG